MRFLRFFATRVATQYTHGWIGTTAFETTNNSGCFVTEKNTEYRGIFQVEQKSSVPANTRGAFGGPPAAADTGAENIGEGRRRLGKQWYAAARRISVGNSAGMGRRAGVHTVRDRWAC